MEIQSLTPAKQTPKQNLLSLKIPGLTDNVKIEFPTRRLPSCEKCKRQFKTRELCRSSKRHETLPWSTVNLCITLNHSCFDKDNNIITDSFSSRTIGWQPYKFKEEAIDVKILMCADCKNKNYTRSACRGRDKYGHLHLPWNTVYCEFTALPSEKTKETASELATNGGEKRNSSPVKEEQSGKCSESSKTSKVKSENQDDNPSSSSPDENSSSASKEENETRKEENKNSDRPTPVHEKSIADSASDEPPSKKAKTTDLPSSADSGLIDFSKVERSRTFFLEVSCKLLKMQWLELDEGVNQTPRYGARFNVHQGFTRSHPSITTSDADHHWYPHANFSFPQMMSPQMMSPQMMSPQMMSVNPYHHFQQMYGLQQQLRQQAGPFSNLNYSAEQLMQINASAQAGTPIQNLNGKNPKQEEV